MIEKGEQWGDMSEAVVLREEHWEGTMKCHAWHAHYISKVEKAHSGFSRRVDSWFSVWMYYRVPLIF